MGTRCDVVLFHHDLDFAERVLQTLRKEVLLLESLLSCFQEGSPVAKFNSMKKGELFSPGETLWEIFQQCITYYKITQGAFDITSLPLITLWKDRPLDDLPDHRHIQEALAISGFENLQFNHEMKEIRKLTDNIGVDFGAIGKGIALDNINKLLKQQKIETAFISFGESSVLALGKHPKGDYWPVGILHPCKPEVILHVFEVVDGCVTTSATLVQKGYRKARSKRHIVDPRSGQAIDSGMLVSVKSESAALGEVLSTSWMILNDGERAILKNNIKEIEIFMAEIAEDIEDNNFSTDL